MKYLPTHLLLGAVKDTGNIFTVPKIKPDFTVPNRKQIFNVKII